ncbi:MAG: sorting and assembly machinery component 50 [Chlorobiaceae bacterium]|nr:sorting and assembly machinery component 50 [Chlorobiaceae bacterium]
MLFYKIVFRVILQCLALSFFCGIALPAAAKNKLADSTEALSPSVYVNKIRFSGNKAISRDELLQIITTSTHSSFLGLGIFGGAKKPFIPEDLQKDLSLIKKLYTYKGYFFAEVASSIAPRNNGKKVDIAINIRENEPSRIDSLAYEGLESIADGPRTQYLQKSVIKTDAVFSVERLIMERDRTIDFFREEGYAFFHEDSIRIKVDTVGTHAGILFKLRLPERLTYGGIQAVVQNPFKSNTTGQKTTFLNDSVTVVIYGRQRINPELISRLTAMRPGRLTKESLEKETLQNLGATNVFSSISVKPDSVKSGKLYTSINLEPAPKHQIEPKLLVDNRYGSVFFGGSIAYENRNLFGGAEQFSAATEFGTQAGYSKTLLSNLSDDQYAKVIPFEFSLKSSLVMPDISKPGNSYSAYLEYSAAKLPILLSTQIGLIRGTYSAKIGKASRINFDFFDFEWIKKDSLKGFRQLFKNDLATNIGIDPTDDAAVNAGIDSLLEARVNQSIRLRYNTTNSASAAPGKNIWNLDLLLEEAGGIAWLIDNYLDTKHYDGFSDKNPQIFGTTYSQYVKLETKLGMTRNLSDSHQLAGRLHLGYMIPYGKAGATPEERRFYAGGANSMRGWMYNTLGPGRSNSEAAANFGANIKLELGLEYRLKFFKFLGQSSGITFFTDIGNIWDNTGPYAFNLRSLTRDFAWDCGAGLRIGSPIGPLRFDFAYKLHDPGDEHPWKISDFNPLDFTFHFGIGETF